MEPTTRLTYVGTEFDTVSMTMRLPLDKLTELQRRIQETLHTSKTTFRNLQSIIRLLNFASQVVASGKAFIRRLIDATLGVKRP